MKNYDILKEFKILYIEDDSSLLKNLSEILEDFVKNLFVAENTTDAYKIIKEKHVDVIISDILIGDKNGLEFISFLKQNGIDIPFILTTAYTETDYLLDAIKLKAVNYLVKPIKIKELLDSLYEVLLPVYQEKELVNSTLLFKIASVICESKQLEVIKMIVKNMDDEYSFSLSYNDIMEEINISKPTLIKLFKDLQDKEVLQKLPKRKYRININKLDEIFMSSNLK
ncbi:response regulator [Nautilia sp. PV-1]|uniref:response regulator n=1 Tax=Nautilia sp. PV-1 TaxID=2579250 RepID=UPI000FD814E8|nr:response regulator [Nautilia sp. PV-1]AZV46995.1 response regulator [Nautilia sp. PV-1]